MNFNEVRLIQSAMETQISINTLDQNPNKSGVEVL